MCSGPREFSEWVVRKRHFRLLMFSLIQIDQAYPAQCQPYLGTLFAGDRAISKAASKAS
jgi:hypothetical protein